MSGTDTSQETHKPTSILGTIRAIFQDSSLPPARKANEVPQWTLAHGFFLQMGGFMLSEGGRPIQTLDLYGGQEGIGSRIKEGIIDPPYITEEDIKDRSKGDTISKTLIILQTTWFTAQCIARWSSHLPVVELEVVTLGFAMLNALTYVLWWHKPQNVGRPVLLEIKFRAPQDRSEATSAQEPEIGAQPDLEEALIPKNSILSKESYIRRQVYKDFEEHSSSEPWKLLYLIPLRFVEGLLRPLGKLADYVPLHRYIQQDDLRVPKFYSYQMSGRTVYGMTTIIGVLFGSVHLIPGWFLDFASVQEKWLWRVSAIVITVGPVFLGLWQYFYRTDWGTPLRSLLLMALPLYIISRIVLLTISLTSLRSLPHAALQTIKWTTFIPHI